MRSEQPEGVPSDAVRASRGRRSRGAGAILFAAAGAAALWLGPHQLPRPERPASPLFDPAAAPEMLEGPERDRWQQPEQVVAALGLRPGAVVADIGAGSGYLLPHLSRAVGPGGRVYAQEIQADYLPALADHSESLGNVRVVLGTAADPGLPPRSVDCFILLTVYHEVQRPIRFLQTLRRAARPGARLAILDFDPDRVGYPPPPAGHSVREAVVIGEAASAGWKLAERHEFLSSQFYLVFHGP
jgi:predicted methyltransferase